VAVVDRQTKAVVGANYRFVLEHDTCKTYPPEVRPAHSLLHYLEEPVKRRLLADHSNGRFLFGSSLFFDVSLQSSDQAKLCFALEADALKMARNQGFFGIVSTNSHPVTKASQWICSTFLLTN
jgi:hypothetical protein